MCTEDGTWQSGDQYLSSVYHQYVPSRKELGSSVVGRFLHGFSRSAEVYGFPDWFGHCFLKGMFLD